MGGDYEQSQDYQHRQKKKWQDRFSQLKKEAHANGQEFKWTSVKSYAENLGYQFENTPGSPQSGLPNFKYVGIQDTTLAKNNPGRTGSMSSKRERVEPLAVEQSRSREHQAAGGATELTSPKKARMEPLPSRMPTSQEPQASGGDAEMTDAPQEEASSSLAPNVTAPGLTPAQSTSPELTHPEWGFNIKWYCDVYVNRQSRPQGAVGLVDLRGALKDCKYPSNSARIPGLYDRARKLLHEMRVTPVSDKAVKWAKMLELAEGLPSVFLPSASPELPFDIVADAKELAVRWRRGDFTGDILQGLNFAKRHPKLSDNCIRFRHDEPGPLQLVNGQWFASWMCALRDGAHGSAQAGIYGQSGNGGAFSIVLAGRYKDVDNGDVVEYCGVRGAENSTEVANSTALLQQNVRRSGVPIRVIRAASAADSKYSPERGLRYDGMYDVVRAYTTAAGAHEPMFSLRRRPGQDPIRWEGPEKRPTREELEQLQQHERFMKSGLE